MTNRTDQGFTLVEMIVVTIILGIIVGIGTLALSTANRSSQVAACRTDFQAVVAAAASFRNDSIDALTDYTLYVASGATAPTGSLPQLGYLSPLVDTGRYRIQIDTTLKVGVFVPNVAGGTTTYVPVSINPYNVEGCKEIS